MSLKGMDNGCIQSQKMKVKKVRNPSSASKSTYVKK